MFEHKENLSENGRNLKTNNQNISEPTPHIHRTVVGETAK